MKPIKICFVTREYAHEAIGNTGGIGVFIKQFAEQLKTKGFLITVFTFGKEAINIDDNGIRVVKIKDLSNFHERLKAPLRKYGVPGYISFKMFLEHVNRMYISLYLSIYVKKHKIDIIEFHDFGGDAAYFFGKIPKVVRCHGTALTLHQFMGYADNPDYTVFEKVFFKRIHQHVVAVSNFSAETTQKAFELKVKPTVIYNGVTIPKFLAKETYLDALTIPKSIFYFGSIRERKGIDIACNTFNNVLAKYPNATFHVLGNNNYDYWNTHAKHILTERALEKTTYYGSVPNTEIECYLQKAHVVLFPSYGENFSIALLEVMALGKLVITSNIPAFQEIITHKVNGLIAENNADYMTYIDRIFNQSIEVETISNQAIQTIITHFDYQYILKQNIHYYKSLLVNNHG